MSNLDLVRIRDLILTDPVALEKWPMVVDHLVKSPADARRIKTHHFTRNADYGEAVLQTLQVWRSGGDEAENLEEILERFGLYSLAHTLQRELEHRTVKGTVFEVGELPFNYVRRSAALHEVQTLLAAEHTPGSVMANVVYIYGLGGVGKTTLARMYAWEALNLHDGNILWINAETSDSLRSSFTSLARRLDIPIKDKTPDSELLEKVYGRFLGKKSLFIFDNAEDKANLKTFLPQAIPGEKHPSILVTTRRYDLIPVKKHGLELGGLSVEEAEHLITSQLTYAPGEDVTKLADRLQRYPLALQQAIAYIKDAFFEDSECIDKYFAELNQSKSEMDLLDSDRFKDDNNYEFTTLNVWNVSLKRLKQVENGLVSIHLLRTLSYLDPDQIKITFVQRVFRTDAEPCLKLLQRFSMVGLNLSSRRVEVHRLVQQVTRVTLCVDDEVDILKQLISIGNTVFTESAEAGFRGDCVWHGLHFLPFQSKHKDVMRETVVYLRHLNIFTSVVAGQERSLALLKDVGNAYSELFEEVDERSLRVKWQAADLLSLQRNNRLGYEEAFAILESILPIAQVGLPSDDQLLRFILQTMGRVCVKTGRFQQAFEVYDELFRLPVAVDGDDRLLFAHYNHVTEQGVGDQLRIEYRVRNALDGIRDLVVRDTRALAQWTKVVSKIVQSKIEARQIRQQLADSNCSQAIFDSLCLWHQNGAERPDLLNVLKHFGLEQLVGQILESGHHKELRAPSSPAPLWYDVGEFPCNFVRRRSLLTQLSVLLDTACSQLTKRTVCVYGPDGGGKSTLARLYAWQKADFYDQNVVWVNGRCTGSMRASFLGFGKKLGLCLVGNTPTRELLERVYACTHGRKCLFVIDDAEEVCQIQEFLSQAPHEYGPHLQMLVVCNTRPTSSFPAEQCLLVDPFSLDEAMDFIQRHLKKPRTTDVEMLAKTLQRLPLALQQAVALIKYVDPKDKDEACIRKYVDEFTLAEVEVLNEGHFGHFGALALWKLVLRKTGQLEEDESASVVSAANILAYLAPECITRPLVKKISESSAAGLKFLERFGIVKLEGDRVKIHELTQQVVRQTMSPGAAQVALRDIIRVMDAELEDSNSEAAMEAASHLLHLFPILLGQPEVLRLKETAACLTKLCTFALTSVSETEAFRVASQSADAYATICGENHEYTAHLRRWMTYINEFISDYSD